MRGEQAEDGAGSRSRGSEDGRAALRAVFVEYRTTRDPRLQDMLVCAHLSLVAKIARRYVRAGVSLDDLVQTGAVGLLKAVKRFDPDHGVAFETYATHFVAGEIRHYLRDGAEPMRTPRWLRKLHGELRATTERLQQELGGTPTLAEIARAMNITEEGVLEITRAYHQGRVASLSDPSGSVELRRELIAHQRYEAFKLPVEDRVVLLEAIDRLAALQRKVVYHLFFLDLSQSETAQRLGVSQRHVSRVLAASLKRLRTILETAALG